MIDIIKLTVSLLVISLVAGLAIGVANSKTKAKIEEQQRQTEQVALRAVLPSEAEISELQGTSPLPEQYWVAKLNGSPAAYAFKISSRGYSSNIVFMVGVDTTGTIMGITILDQNETPGLGTRVLEVSSKKYLWKDLFSAKDNTKPWFTEQFEGVKATSPIGIEKQFGEWHKLDQNKRTELEQQNKITAITGSTISTRAVTRGLENQASAYVKALQE